MRLNHFIGSIIHLCLDQFIYNTAQTYKSLGPFLCGIAEIRLNHDGVLPVVHFTVHNSERVVFHRRVCWYCFLCRRVITDIGQIRFLVFANDIPYRFRKLIPKISVIEGNTDRFQTAVHAFIQNHLAKNHFGVINKVAVDRDPVRVFPEMHPIRLDINHPIPLLQKDDI